MIIHLIDYKFIGLFLSTAFLAFHFGCSHEWNRKGGHAATRREVKRLTAELEQTRQILHNITSHPTFNLVAVRGGQVRTLQAVKR